MAKGSASDAGGFLGTNEDLKGNVDLHGLRCVLPGPHKYVKQWPKASNKSLKGHDFTYFWGSRYVLLGEGYEFRSLDWIRSLCCHLGRVEWGAPGAQKVPKMMAQYWVQPQYSNSPPKQFL